MAMWQKLSLRARLNMLLALVLVLGLVINVARLLSWRRRRGWRPKIKAWSGLRAVLSRLWCRISTRHPIRKQGSIRSSRA